MAAEEPSSKNRQARVKIGRLSPTSHLAVAGVVPLSSVDWPNKLCATVFLQGCPWRCPYCQNYEILDSKAPGRVSWDYVQALLERRRGLLDGVVFSGGEALRQEALPAAMAQVRELGFEVGLHSAGAYPRRFAEVLEYTDWVGLDIKALPEDYRAAAGCDAGAKAYECLDLLLAAAAERGTAYEVRTTVYPHGPAAERFEELVAELRRRGVEHFALQEARTAGTDPLFEQMAQRWNRDAWRSRFAELESVARAAGFTSVEIRLA